MAAIKHFKKGYYYQTYDMMLKVWCDDEQQKWYYTTYLRKNNKEEWKICKCIFEKIKPHIDELIDMWLNHIKSYDIEEELIVK